MRFSASTTSVFFAHRADDIGARSNGGDPSVANAHCAIGDDAEIAHRGAGAGPGGPPTVTNWRQLMTARSLI